MNEIVLVYSTFADESSAKQIAKELVSKKLCACANIIPKITSIYEWQDELCESSEAGVIFKTTKNKLQALQIELEQLHPYELPAFITIDASASEQFFYWITSKTV